MPRSHPFSRNTPRSVLRGVLASVTAVTLAAGMLALTPSAANADPTEAASATALTGGDLGGNWGQKIVFEQPTQAVNNPRSWKLDPQTDGTVRIIDASGGVCLSINSTIFPIGTLSGRLFPDLCKDDTNQRFYFVPQNHTPHSVANMSRGDQYFYIASAATQQCLWSADGGFNQANFFDSSPQLKTCSEGDPGEEFRVYNEQPNPAGIYNEWQNILNLAAIYATNRCAADYLSCEVSSPNGAYPNQWFRPNDDAIAGMGTISTRSFGCGVGTKVGDTTYSPTETNYTLDNETKTVGSQLSVTNTTEVTNTLGYNLSVEVSGGLKDVWGVKVTNGFTYENKVVKGSSIAQSTTDTTSRTIRPGDTLMATWAGSVFNVTGTWKFAENLAVLDPEHRTLQWTMPATSSFPVTVQNAPVAKLAGVTSRLPKNCDASAASTIKPTSEPTIAAATSDCTGTIVTPATASAGTTLKACPGEWDVPVGKGSSTPTFVYQWYVVGPDGTAKFPIDGANKQTFTVQPSTYSAATPNLLVSVYDEGNADRLESRPAVITPVKVVITPSAVGGNQHIATNFVGSIDDAQTGAAYSADLVSAAGTGMHLSVASALPAGMSLSPTGVLTGTPEAAGTYDIDLVDNPTDGGPAQTSTVILTVYNPPAAFRTDTALTATVGTSVDAALVPSIPLGMNLRVTSGSLPVGMTLDSSTGVLSGTPVVAGAYGFALQDPASPNTYGAFSLAVSNQASVLSDAGVGAAQVGSAYTADTVASLGTNTLIGLAASSDPLPAGLTINALTGRITGTPTAAGSAALTLVDLNDPAVSATATIEVQAAAPGSSTSAPAAAAKPASLAATGLDATGMLVAAFLLLAAGIAFTARRLRRQH